MFGKRSEGLSKILSKGDSIFVEGSLRTTSYTKDGEKRFSTEVVARDVLLLGGDNRSDQSGYV
jgi:single-strand DNA-binding protein